MTNRYIDTSLSGTTATYNPTAAEGSRDTGGSDAGYQTFGDAFAAIDTDTTFIFRGGQSHTESVQRIIAATGVKIENYTGENVTFDITDNSILLNVASAGITVNGAVGGGTFQMSTSNAAVIEAIFRIYASDSVFNDVQFISTGGAYCIRHQSPTITGVTFNRCSFKNLVSATAIAVDNGTNGTAGTLFFNSCIIDEAAVLVSKYVDTQFNNCILRAPQSVTTPTIKLTDASATLTVNNSIVFGAGADGSETQPNFEQTAGTFNVNNSIVNGNFFNPALFDSGTITYTDCVNNAAVLWDDYAYSGRDLIFCLVQHDSTFYSSTGPEYSDEYLTMLASRDANISVFSDDQYLISQGADKQAAIAAWEASGNEVGNKGYSADLKTATSPLTVTYGGAGANPRVVISGNGASLALVTDSGTDATFDTSRSFTSTNGVFGGTVTSGKLAQSIHDTVDWSATLASSLFDDTLAYTLADGSYSAVSASEEPLLFDTTRRWYEEIDWSISVLEDYMSGSVSSQISIAGDADASYIAAVTAYGLSVFITDSGDNTAQPIGTASTLALQSFGVGTDSFGGTLIQDDLEQQARIVVTELAYNKGYSIGVCNVAGTAGAWTATVAGYFIDELLSHGVRVMNVKDAATYISANQSAYSETTRPTGVQVSGSQGLEIGKKWWTGPEPVGINGEPFSDMETDIGASQSTLGDFHPANI